mgnify:CR=1 FL=1|tara:strand:+ start:183 stop:1430 length:1248 start_codon:yes stop_codon:yes gene_type:complete
MNQEIKYIPIKDLVLWTENPRDPINKDATDQEVVNKAFIDKMAKWNLGKLAKEMGPFYDLSELPTVVYHDNKPIVYDGNRRIVLGKVKYGLVTIPKKINFQIPDYPEEIPCNVCTKKVGLENVLRKHGDSGSWLPLERDIFLHKFMGKEKSPFLILEEDTGIISTNPKLNQRFVKEEIFKEEILTDLGFYIKNGSIHSVHSDQEGFEILNDLSQKVESKTISTRNNRGKVLEILEPRNQQLIAINGAKKSHLSKINFRKSDEGTEAQKLSPRTRKRKQEIFGGKLFLELGETSNLYRDITDLFNFYITRKDSLSDSFPGLIRMALRLLCESASKDKKSRMDKYLNGNYDLAKNRLDQDIKTTLANQNVSKASLVQLLQTGAHGYQSSSNLDQTIAMSIIIGEIITISHSKNNGNE